MTHFTDFMSYVDEPARDCKLYLKFGHEIYYLLITFYTYLSKKKPDNIALNTHLLPISLNLQPIFVRQHTLIKVYIIHSFQTYRVVLLNGYHAIFKKHGKWNMGWSKMALGALFDTLSNHLTLPHFCGGGNF